MSAPPAARAGLDVTVLDYSHAGLREIRVKAEAANVSGRIRTLAHDAHTPLPFDIARFDAGYPRGGESENSVVYPGVDPARVNRIQLRNLLGPLTNGFPRS
jgi:hypothetical protein